MSILQEALKRKEEETKRQAQSICRLQDNGGQAAPLPTPSFDSLAGARTQAGMPRTDVPAGEPVTTACPAKRSGEEAERDGRLPTSLPENAAQKMSAGDAAPASDIPAQSMPVPQSPVEAPLPGAPKRRTAAALWITIAAILLLLVLAAATGGLYLMRHIPALKTIAAQAGHKAGITPAGPQASGPAGKSAAVEHDGSLVATNPPAVAEGRATSNQTAETPKKVLTSPVSGQNAETQKPAAFKLKWSSNPPPEEEKKWPTLKLMGILRSSINGESAAYINGKTTKAGQTVEGVTVVDIQSDRVLLKYGRETKTLRVGGIPY